MFDIEVIPKNTQYCYTLVDKTVSGSGDPILKTQVCPYWSLVGERNGRCEFIGKSDSDLENETLSHLWDMVKDCDISR